MSNFSFVFCLFYKWLNVGSYSIKHILYISIVLSTDFIRSEGIPYKEASSFTRIGGTVLSEYKSILLPTKAITALKLVKKPYLTTRAMNQSFLNH